MINTNYLSLGIVADLLDERWPSMDLMADMLMAYTGRNGTCVTPSLIRPSFSSRLPLIARGSGDTPATAQRIAHRFWSYPRWLRRHATYDLYHIVDHSYAHLAHVLPADRVVITCHDVDAFRALMPVGDSESTLPRVFVKRVLTGLQRAAAIVCDSEATRSELVANGLAAADRTSVVPIAVHPACTATPLLEPDTIAEKLTGDAGPADLLHVGSTIPRKRIEFLLDVLARTAAIRPDVRLWRVGGSFTASQLARARELGVEQRITVVPFVTRPVLAALYRRAALVLLPSEREGFGLPVIESMACGTPIICSDLPVLREVGGVAAEYCRVDDPSQWAMRIDALLTERKTTPEQWRSRQARCLSHSSAYSWHRYASEMQSVYLSLAGTPVCA